LLDSNLAAFGYVLDYVHDGCRPVIDLLNNEAILQRLRTNADYFELANDCDEQEQVPEMKHFHTYKTSLCIGHSDGWRLHNIYPNGLSGNSKSRKRTEYVFGRIE